jgi:hypothetical protein
MNERTLSEWSEKELLKKERSYPIGDTYGDELRAEISRRHVQRNQRYMLAGVVVAAISAIGSMLAAVASLLSIHLR